MHKRKGNDFLSLDDLDLPIALRKEKGQCTRHPLSHFEKLSPSYQAFVSKLNSIETPKTVHEALRNDNQRKALMEEMSALIKK